MNNAENKSADYNMGAYDAIDSVMLALSVNQDMTREELILAMREVQLVASEQLSKIAQGKAKH